MQGMMWGEPDLAVDIIWQKQIKIHANPEVNLWILKAVSFGLSFAIRLHYAV